MDANRVTPANASDADRRSVRVFLHDNPVPGAAFRVRSTGLPERWSCGAGVLNSLSRVSRRSVPGAVAPGRRVRPWSELPAGRHRTEPAGAAPVETLSG